MGLWGLVGDGEVCGLEYSRCNSMWWGVGVGVGVWVCECVNVWVWVWGGVGYGGVMEDAK